MGADLTASTTVPSDPHLLEQLLDVVRALHAAGALRCSVLGGLCVHFLVVQSLQHDGLRG